MEMSLRCCFEILLCNIYGGVVESCGKLKSKMIGVS
jgi:hypothetical protein